MRAGGADVCAPPSTAFSQAAFSSRYSAIGGNFEADSNTSSVLIIINSVTGNMSVGNNTGPLDVVSNDVDGTLKCLNNSNLIMGGGRAK